MDASSLNRSKQTARLDRNKAGAPFGRVWFACHKMNMEGSLMADKKHISKLSGAASKGVYICLGYMNSCHVKELMK